MKHLDHLFDDYYSYWTDEDPQGSLVCMSPTGDTLLPPFQGRFAILEEIDDVSRVDAYGRPKALVAAARWWAEGLTADQLRTHVTACEARLLDEALVREEAVRLEAARDELRRRGA